MNLYYFPLQLFSFVEGDRYFFQANIQGFDPSFVKRLIEDCLRDKAPILICTRLTPIDEDFALYSFGDQEGLYMAIDRIWSPEEEEEYKWSDPLTGCAFYQVKFNAVLISPKFDINPIKSVLESKALAYLTKIKEANHECND